MQALGFIETRGLVAAIESADAMLKAAEVHLLERSFVKGGIVTITVTGDVAACKASVDAGVAAVERMHGIVLSHHVIPRPHDSLNGLIISNPTEEENPSEEIILEEVILKEVVSKEIISKEIPVEEVVLKEVIPEETPIKEDISEESFRSQIEKMIEEDKKESLDVFLNAKKANILKELIDKEYKDLDLNGKSPYELTKKEIIAKLKDFYK